MKRLTKQTSFYKDAYDFTEEVYDNPDGPKKIAWTLGKYEDTGLDPFEVDKLARDNYDRNKGCPNCATGVYVNKTRNKNELLGRAYRESENKFYKFCPRCGRQLRKLTEDENDLF